MANTFKPIQSRNKEELIELYERYIAPLESDKTKDELKASLAEVGITNKDLKLLENKIEVESQEVTPDTSSMSVVYMVRDNLSYGFKNYRFTRQDRYVLMTKEDAEELVNSTFGFRIASKEEVARHFRL